MSLTRIKGVLLQELYITLGSAEVIFDIFVFSLISLLLFGFLSLYLSGNKNPLIAEYVLSGMLFWEIVRIVQYSVSVGSLWNIWARNLSNMFISPLSFKEYIFAHTLSGVIKTLIMFIIDSTIMIFVFHFNIYQLGFINIFLLSINLVLFSFSTGIAILGLIFRFGTRIQAFAWGIIPILQPLSAAFFPVNILPQPLQSIAYLFPSTYVFEASRYSLTFHKIDWLFIGIAFLLNLIYLLLGILAFNIMFNKSKDSGQFARNEG